jgi:hypothetical protein
MIVIESWNHGKVTKNSLVNITWSNLLGWLVVLNMNFIVPYVGNFIIPTDELHDFSEG